MWELLEDMSMAGTEPRASAVCVSLTVRHTNLIRTAKSWRTTCTSGLAPTAHRLINQQYSLFIFVLTQVPVFVGYVAPPDPLAGFRGVGPQRGREGGEITRRHFAFDYQRESRTPKTLPLSRGRGRGRGQN